jgi:hypothetical protein
VSFMVVMACVELCPTHFGFTKYRLAQIFLNAKCGPVHLSVRPQNCTLPPVDKQID